MDGNGIGVYYGGSTERAPALDDFILRPDALPALQNGDVLIRNRWMSIDPNVFVHLQRAAHSHTPVALRGAAIGVVEQSREKSLPEGALVRGSFGWRDRCVARADAVTLLPPSSRSPTLYLGILGMPGITAYIGCELVLAVKPGETVYVSGATGAVGSVAVQLLRRQSARVLASARSARKQAWLSGELDAKDIHLADAESLEAFFARAVPGGLHACFDNVGGEVLDSVLRAMNVFGRIAVCGALSKYGDKAYRRGPEEFFRIVERSLSLIGFNWMDYRSRFPTIIAELERGVDAGALVSAEEVVKGLDKAVPALLSMLEGRSDRIGKLIVEL